MVKMQFTTSASCRSNTAYTIGGVNWAAKRQIQRKALHQCRNKNIYPEFVGYTLNYDSVCDASSGKVNSKGLYYAITECNTVQSCNCISFDQQKGGWMNYRQQQIKTKIGSISYLKNKS